MKNIDDVISFCNDSIECFSDSTYYFNEDIEISQEFNYIWQALAIIARNIKKIKERS